MAVGDKALAGYPEDIQGYFFPPDPTQARTIYFKGVYLSIVNKDTKETKETIDVKAPAADHHPYQVPAGYTIYVRGANVYFKT
jgi:hypothetical protein